MAHQKEIDALFARIASTHDAMIRRICMAYASPQTPVDDLVQEALVAIWRGLGSFRGEAALSTWLYRTVLNTCISYIRSMARHSHGVSLNEASAISVDTEISERELHDHLYTHIGALSPIDKAIVLMWLDEKSYAEIAEITGLKPGVVGTRLTRARQRLKAMMTKD